MKSWAGEEQQRAVAVSTENFNSGRKKSDCRGKEEIPQLEREAMPGNDVRFNPE